MQSDGIFETSSVKVCSGFGSFFKSRYLAKPHAGARVAQDRKRTESLVARCSNVMRDFCTYRLRFPRPITLPMSVSSTARTSNVDSVV